LPSGLSGKLWPAHLKPEPDELLSSWLIRLAAANGQKLHTFCVISFPDVHIWNRDIDKSCTDSFLQGMAARSGETEERARETSLRSFEGVLYERHNPNGNSPWILPVGVYRRTRRAFGLQYCPACLQDDREPYFRKQWRLACITVCTKHKLCLQDHCPFCFNPVVPQRLEMGTRPRYQPEPLHICSFCRKDLIQQTSLIEAEEREWHAVHWVERTLAVRYAPIGEKQEPALLVFRVLHQLLRLLSTGKRAGLLAQSVASSLHRQSPEISWPQAKCRDFEKLRATARRELLVLATELLEDWPHKFLEHCRRCQLWSSTVLKDFDEPSFFYESVVKGHLYQSVYAASEAEVAAAWAYLCKRSTEPNANSLARLLGCSEIFRKRPQLRNLLKPLTLHVKPQN